MKAGQQGWPRCVVGGSTNMRHVQVLSRVPRRASTNGLCDNFQNDSQVKLCFTAVALVDFLLPMIQLSADVATGKPGEDAPDDEAE